jgi:crotonobetainyl-CoA:carnitine CoA-transferase CaiB-like acyl-CoA transferase
MDDDIPVRGPLQGIKVIDFAGHGFVPSAAAALADWGADVVKIERLTGDPLRAVIRDGLVADADGTDYIWEFFNRNKRGLALDIETRGGREIFERLVRWADVYITNQLPRVRRKLRTEPADILALNPRIVYAKGHGQGQRGVDAEAGGFDSVSFWSRGGVGHMLSVPGSGHPVGPRAAMGDAPSGMFLAAGICAALVGVARTGTGVVVDTSLLASAMWTLAPDMAYASIAGEEPPRARPDPAARSPLVGQHQTVDGRWLSLSMLDEDRYWARTCRAVGLPHLADEFPDAEARAAHRKQIHDTLDAAIAQRTRDELNATLRAEECIFSFFASPPEVLADDAAVANGYAPAHPSHASLRLTAAPAQFDDELPRVRRAAPETGQHTREILGELDYSPSEIDGFFADGVVIESRPRGDVPATG